MRSIGGKGVLGIVLAGTWSLIAAPGVMASSSFSEGPSIDAFAPLESAILAMRRSRMYDSPKTAGLSSSDKLGLDLAAFKSALEDGSSEAVLVPASATYDSKPPAPKKCPQFKHCTGGGQASTGDPKA